MKYSLFILSLFFISSESIGNGDLLENNSEKKTLTNATEMRGAHERMRKHVFKKKNAEANKEFSSRSLELEIRQSREGSSGPAVENVRTKRRIFEDLANEKIKNSQRGPKPTGSSSSSSSSLFVPKVKERGENIEIAGLSVRERRKIFEDLEKEREEENLINLQKRPQKGSLNETNFGSSLPSSSSLLILSKLEEKERENKDKEKEEEMEEEYNFDSFVELSDIQSNDEERKEEKKKKRKSVTFSIPEDHEDPQIKNTDEEEALNDGMQNSLDPSNFVPVDFSKNNDFEEMTESLPNLSYSPEDDLEENKFDGKKEEGEEELQEKQDTSDDREKEGSNDEKNEPKDPEINLEELESSSNLSSTDSQQNTVDQEKKSEKKKKRFSFSLKKNKKDSKDSLEKIEGKSEESESSPISSSSDSQQKTDDDEEKKSEKKKKRFSFSLKKNKKDSKDSLDKTKGDPEESESSPISSSSDSQQNTDDDKEKK